MSLSIGIGMSGEFSSASRLAAAAARPLSRTGPLPLACGTLTSADLSALAARPEFRAPLERALARRLGWTAPARADLAALCASERGRLAIALAAADHGALEGAALWTAAAVLHKRILMLAAKADRQTLRACLGEDVFRFATSEAPTLHPALSHVEGGDDVWSRIMDADAAVGRTALVGFGSSVVLAFCKAQHVALGALLARSVPAAAPVRTMSEPVAAQLVKLLRRRRGPWPGTIV